MTVSASAKLSVIVLAAIATCGCANSGFDLSTASVPANNETVAFRPDPMCVSLANQINNLKSDGSIGRLEKAATGKSTKVEVKREALQKQAELNKANTDFQSRCGPGAPKQLSAQTTVASPPRPAQTASGPASDEGKSPLAN